VTLLYSDTLIIFVTNLLTYLFIQVMISEGQWFKISEVAAIDMSYCYCSSLYICPLPALTNSWVQLS